jgi:hypothetical protein
MATAKIGAEKSAAARHHTGASLYWHNFLISKKVQLGQIAPTLFG